MAEKSEAHSISHGTDEEEHDPSALQKHATFFDINKDGIIYPWETFQGFRAIGCGILLSTFASFCINLGLSRKTRPVKNIERGKHGSDSGVYDTAGRFVPSKFEEIFGNHAQTNKNALTSDELKKLLQAHREPKDYKGWVASFTEWMILG